MKRSHDIRGEIVLKAFLSKQDPKHQRELTHFLSKEAEERIHSIKPPDADPIASTDLLEKIHWSWFLPILKTYSEIEQKLFLSVLKPHAAKNLARALTLSLNGVELTQVALSYLKKHLLESLIGKQNRLLPLEYLPQCPMKKLLHLTKKELTSFIDLLSMHDLSYELNQIVETKILKKIYSLLTDEEKKLLKQALNRKNTFSIGRLRIDRWDGSEESLRLALHRRGLMRLGAGLSGQDPDFLWYLCHQLDIGRGSALHRTYAKEMIPGITEVILKQIEELL